MNDRTKLNALKANILQRRRQRIRLSTYSYVSETILEETRLDHPFRDRMVLDWWHRIVDPLEAESFDVERLRYFRERLIEHRRAPTINAAIRQNKVAGTILRRLQPEKQTYVRLQIRRLSDRRLNYAAAERAVNESDQAFEALFIGLIALPKLKPGPNSFLDKVACKATSDERSMAVLPAPDRASRSSSSEHPKTAD